MRQWIADLLIPAAEFIRQSVSAIPMTAVRALVFGVLVSLAFWVFSLAPQVSETSEGFEKKSIWNDLRFFAIAVLGLQALLYIIF
ncbi:MAG: hypothetical protein ACYC9O_14035 [Candidatus Latescibacterota bacterium]